MRSPAVQPGFAAAVIAIGVAHVLVLRATYFVLPALPSIGYPAKQSSGRDVEPFTRRWGQWESGPENARWLGILVVAFGVFLMVRHLLVSKPLRTVDRLASAVLLVIFGVISLANLFLTIGALDDAMRLWNREMFPAFLYKGLDLGVGPYIAGALGIALAALGVAALFVKSLIPTSEK